MLGLQRPGGDLLGGGGEEGETLGLPRKGCSENQENILFKDTADNGDASQSGERPGCA